MADPNRPEFHEFADSIGTNPKHKSLDYAELKRRADLKKADFERTKQALAQDIKIDEYENVPREGLAEIEHYSQMPDVEIDSEVSEFWKAQQDALEQPKQDLKAGKSEYESAYKDWQDLIERMDDRRRDELGVNNYHEREYQAKYSVTQAKRRLADAKEKVASIQYDVDPFKALVGAITGTNKDAKSMRDAYRSVEDARKGLRDAKRNLAQVRENRAALEEKKASLSVQEYSVLQRMSDAQVKIEEAKETAKQIVEGGKDGRPRTADVQARLRQQFDLIEKYRAIQALKKNSERYAALSSYLENSTPENKVLLAQLNSIPNNVPTKAFRITLQGPLQLLGQSDKITEVDKKIASLRAKLPANLYMQDLTADLEANRLHDTDTIETLTQEMEEMKNNGEETSEKYQQLQRKLDYLVAQQEIDNCQQEIDQLTIAATRFETTPEYAQLKTKLETEFAKKLEDEVQKQIEDQIKAKVAEERQASPKAKIDIAAIRTQIDTPENRTSIQASLQTSFDKACEEKVKTESSKMVQSKLNQLRTKQQVIKLKKEQLQNSPYVTTISNLEELQSLVTERESLAEQVDLPSRLDSTAEGLRQVRETRPPQEKSTFALIYESIQNARRQNVEKIAVKHGKEETEQQQLPQPENEGR